MRDDAILNPITIREDIVSDDNDLDQWLGSWSGTWSTWLEPTVLHDESPLALEVRRDDDGWALSYRGAIRDDEVTGAIRVLGPDMTSLEWVDTWHTAGEEQHLVGGPGTRPSYTYGPEDDTWTWGIDIAAAVDSLVITHWNTPPQGPQVVAVRMTVTR